jgi:Flp pilus assembly protein TadG
MIEASKRPQGGLLRRLRKDTTGNTLFLVAAGILPLTAMIGAGVDISRSYLVKARLQQACDAGALVARKSMGAGGLTTQGSDRAQAFFRNNFPPSAFGTSNISFTPTQTADGNITATARSRIPMTVMTVFGNDYTDIEVRCDAKLEISNTDVMFVLDTTGSMLESGGSGTKIQGLREAVMTFYDTLDGALDPTAQLRYGIVPYSSTVNLGTTNMPGGILPPEWVVDNWAYQTRDANMNTPVYTETITSDVTTTQIYSASISSTQCSDYGRNRYPTTASNPVTSGTAPSTVTVTSYTNNATTGVDYGWPGAPDTSGTTRSCRRQQRVVTKNYTLAGYTFTNWTYQQSSLDVSSFKLGNSITISTGSAGQVPTSGTYTLRQLATTASSPATSSFTWNGCIEERDTVPANQFSPIPAGALDLDVDGVPTNDDTRWRPMFPQMMFRRSTQNEETTTSNLWQPIGANSDFAACPSRARKLGGMTRSELQNYVNGLVAVGGTYHDTGFLWGLRLMSPTGIFAAENTSAPNGKPISRHIIFMSDGQMAPNESIYGLYGMERLDQRITGNDGLGNMTGRHNGRFLALCEEAKARNITVWTIAFGTGAQSTMTTCADPGKALVANNNTDLATQFSQIATKIAQLRLAQ